MKFPKFLKANDKDLNLPAGLNFEAQIDIQAQSGEDGDKEGLPKFKMKAYTGGKMTPMGFYHPVIVSLKGVRVPRKKIPARLDHDASKGVGHTESVTIDTNGISAEGVISRDTAWAKDVAQSGKNGFPWQVSIGASIDKVTFIPEKESAIVNGKNYTGPFYLISESTLKEISFVDCGADERTSAKIAAKNNNVSTNLGAISMNFKQWLEAKGVDVDGLAVGDLEKYQNEFDTEMKASAEDSTTPAKTQKTESDPADHISAMQEKAAAELSRQAKIAEICGSSNLEIQAKAVKEGWSVEKTELEVLRAARPSGDTFNINTGKGSLAAGDSKVLEAAAMMAGGINPDKVIDTHGAKAVECAADHFKGGISLQQLLLQAAWQNGSNVRFIRSMADVREVLQAAFSTVSLPGILSNTANKFLLDGFDAVESTWRKIAKIRNVKDFKQATSHRLVAGAKFDEVGPDGELKHGELGEESYTNQAKTHGKMFTITRQDIINDDLDALVAIPSQIGRGGALKLNEVFWASFLDNSSFFTSGNKNYAGGITTALSIDALTAAELLFYNQTVPNGDPLAVEPAILLVPNALQVTASQIMKSSELRDTTTSKKTGTTNPHAGKFEVARSSYLSNAALTGNSTKAWYLLADPRSIPVIEVAFLNGNQSPTVESADADFNVLGIQMRGFYDFGVNKQEYRGGVKMKGEA